jgi:hypothetical protein
VVADCSPSPRETTHGRQVRDQQGQRLKVPIPPEGTNGEIIAASQGYATKASAEKGIEAIKYHAISAKVEDLSDG